MFSFYNPAPPLKWACTRGALSAAAPCCVLHRPSPQRSPHERTHHSQTPGTGCLSARHTSHQLKAVTRSAVSDSGYQSWATACGY
eukprot:6174209-Pleurochrysis_carterae.AAC.1